MNNDQPPNPPTIDNLLPDIISYLQSTQNEKYAISIEDLDELVSKVRSKTGLSRDAAQTVIRLIFHEIRSEVLKGNDVKIYPIGYLKFKIRRSRANSTSIEPIFKNTLIYLNSLRKYDSTP